jgi:hypothetical protein
VETELGGPARAQRLDDHIGSPGQVLKLPLIRLSGQM